MEHLIGSIKFGAASMIESGKALDQTTNAMFVLNSQKELLQQKFNVSNKKVEFLTEKNEELGENFNKLVDFLRSTKKGKDLHDRFCISELKETEGN